MHTPADLDGENKMTKKPCMNVGVAALILALGALTPAGAQEVWTVENGSSQLTLSRAVLQRAGLTVTGDELLATQPGARITSAALVVAPNSTMEWQVQDGMVQEEWQGRLTHFGSLTFASGSQRLVLENPTLVPSGDCGFTRLRLVDGNGRTGGLDLERVKFGFIAGERTLRLHVAEVHLSSIWAKQLGDARLTRHDLGSFTVYIEALWLGGDEPDLGHPASPRGAPSIGPDMTFCQLYGLGQYGREDDITGLSLGTTAWGAGDADVMWFGRPDVEHPFIVMDMFRLKDDRFEQIGQSWIKHGFYALGNTQCGGSCSFEPGHAPGDWLGQGCTDTYTTGLNASQNGLGPRYEVNPWTGDWVYEGSHMAEGSTTHDGVEHRLQVHDDDLDPALNEGATYYGESYYAIKDDVNVMNSIAWKPTTVSGSPGGTWSFGMSDSGTYPNIGIALDAWAGATQTIFAQEIPVIEFVSPDGRCIVGSKATDIGGGFYHYEYAVMNIDMDRQVGSFTVPIPSGAGVVNIGFHAVEHHDEPVNEVDGTPIDNAPWTPSLTATDITWSTTTNPIRWGTLYNFRFDADVEPGTITASMGMFKPGTPTSLSGDVVGPAGPPPVCGDLQVTGTEHCDPPNVDGCGSDCRWFCGDGVGHPPLEPCDDAGESATCDLDCTPAECGDGMVNTTRGEACDDAGNSETCDMDCTIAECGDGYINDVAGEECEPPGTANCDAECIRIPMCGDGITDPGEGCDDGNLQSGDGCSDICEHEYNDECADALILTEGDTVFDTEAATTDGNGHSDCQFDGQTYNDIWYTYEPSCGGELTISTCNSANYDTDLVIYNTCTCIPEDERVLDCNDDTGGCSTYTSTLNTHVTAGDCYLVRVGGYSSSSRGAGTLVVTLETPQLTPGDMDGDGQITEADYAGWYNCMTEPCEGCEPAMYVASCCTAADIDADGDVDLKDYVAMCSMMP